MKAGDLGEAAWLGFSLTALFLCPVAFALDSNAFYLQWQRSHTAEAGAAALTGTVLFGGLCLAVRGLRGLPGAVALGAIAALPLASFAVALARALPLRHALIPLWEHQAIRYGAPAVSALLTLAAVVARPESFRRAVRSLIQILSPVSFVVAWLFLGPGLEPGPVAASEPTGPATGITTPARRCGPLLALLFDELSFSYLYDARMQVRPEFPNLRSFSRGATSHLAVTSPGPETLTAMPGFLAARRVAGLVVADDRLLELRPEGPAPLDARGAGGLFATARRLGFRTEMAGYYLPYCELLGELADVCRSFSFYNAASAGAGFSAWHPVLTTFILWPRQFPFGLVKSPAFAAHQARLVEHTLRFALRPLGGGKGVFRLVHFSVPHLPFAFDRHGYRPPADALQTSPDIAYRRQVEFTDELFGRIVRTLSVRGELERSWVVVLSDHGYRFGGRERDPRQVPFIVKAPEQRAAEFVRQPEHAERLLVQTVEAACAPR